MVQTCICGEPATFQANRIVPGGAPLILGSPPGDWEITYWCDEHFAILARETRDRYTFDQLETTPRRRRAVDGQGRWELNGT